MGIKIIMKTVLDLKILISKKEYIYIYIYILIRKTIFLLNAF
jgi:hypothetical protein